MIHSYNQFHAAGHGTFFSGHLVSGINQQERFLWVYDCGSKRQGRMNALVKDLHNFSKNPEKHFADTDQIDMLCLSHFDADHVNGLIDLLKIFKVKRLFLPYLPFQTRLALACEFDLDATGSTDAMLFTLDPAGYLARRDLTHRVGGFVLVQGGEGGAENEPRNIDDLPLEPNTPDDSGVGSDADEGGEYSRLIGYGRRSNVTQISHSQPIVCLRGLWEFMFYNKELPSGITPKSTASLADVQKDVTTVLNKWDLIRGGHDQVEGWRKDLRECYEKHFGDSSKGRNDISLCVLSRPMRVAKFAQCTLFDMPTGMLGNAHALIPVSQKEKSGLLLTGDISIDKKELASMQKHFSQRRWKDIHVMQIPHHGSRHSWETGSAKLCKHEYSVLCVPDIDKAGAHPHIDVMDDLQGHNPLCANYSNSVVYCFHPA
jgi:hypothetical protein